METREKLTLTKEQARMIIWGDSYEYTEVYNKTTDKSRWSVICEIVIKRNSDGKFFMDTYQKAATECQDEQPYEYTEPDFTEVFPVVKTIIVYE